MKYLKYYFIVIFVLSFSKTDLLFSQGIDLKPLKIQYKTGSFNNSNFDDSTKKETGRRKFTAGGVFLNIGTGLSVPLRSFTDNSKPTFGILARLEYSSTKIFPVVIGAEIDYFSYIPDAQFKTLNLLSTYRTKVVSVGLNIEYSLARLFNSPYSIPFITLDVKTNRIKRDIDDGRTLDGLPAKDSKVSFGVGAGITLFVFDFYFKYNFMKELTNFGVYAKMKFPIIRF